MSETIPTPESAGKPALWLVKGVKIPVVILGDRDSCGVARRLIRVPGNPPVEKVVNLRNLEVAP